jgi:hypothetical protein
MRRVAIVPSIALVGGAAFFLWMFLAVAPLESLADSGGFSGTDLTRVATTSYRFAADWRHGMAGNSPLYMPGFFVLALATWLWVGGRDRRIVNLVLEGAGILLLGLVFAWGCSDVAQTAIVSSFERSSGLTVAASWPEPSGRAIGQGLYTAIAWMTSIGACRRALDGRTFAPLLVIPPVTIVLALIRPWTVDDFTALWIDRAMSGSVAAIGSLAAIPLLAVALIWSTGGRQWVQTQRSERRTAVDV